MLETTWESEAPPGRPPRHMYRLTHRGLNLANELARSARSSRSARLRLQVESA